ncbi:Nudix hydrolase 2 [Tetrabaena socialis]|uniref:Nudix hydrolase 2 n=1 Tax=Tetrabaena socialis TaxID=47790 RepID=A0A2J8AIH3_9CHLO|nr:Nudix hydrolase 2 [Tetrabaena socialis]|eukprot:PNH12312.1 Nudix hydrolase 2 [Tetrabaena socialis]
MRCAQERSGVLRGKGVWKMPTGLVAAGERGGCCGKGVSTQTPQLLESNCINAREAGVTARVEAVLALRQAHGFAFGKSDMFVVCGMRPEPDLQEALPQESELVDARWVPVEEYMEQEFFSSMPLYKLMLEKCQAWAEGRYQGMHAVRMDSNVTRKRTDLLVYGDDTAPSRKEVEEPTS